MGMFRGSRILITGSSRGIGLATARLLAAEGADVVINEPSERQLEVAARQLASEGHQVRAVAGGVETADGCKSIVERAVAVLGGLDVLVNCAGIYRQGPCETFSEAEWDRTLNINLKGTYFTTMEALPHLRVSRGNVVNLASEAGLRGARLSAVYSASKGGVVLLTKSQALEFAPTVRVNCVCPGAVDTDMIRDVASASGDTQAYLHKLRESYPMRRIAEPVEVAKAIRYLASPDAMNITGSALAIDGGSTAGR